jgi:hypothetical protein
LTFAHFASARAPALTYWIHTPITEAVVISRSSRAIALICRLSLQHVRGFVGLWSLLSAPSAILGAHETIDLQALSIKKTAVSTTETEEGISQIVYVYHLIHSSPHMEGLPI